MHDIIMGYATCIWGLARTLCVCVLLHVQLWLILERGFVAVIMNGLPQSTNINYMYIALV